MNNLDLINHIYSVELNLDKETIENIERLSKVFILDNIFTTKDTKQDVLDKLNELYPNKNFFKKF